MITIKLKLYIYLINYSSYTLNAENLVQRSLQILYIFVLRARVSTTFPSEVGFFPRVVQKYAKFANTPPPQKSRLYLWFSNLLIIKNASTKKINTMEDVWKSEEEIT